MAPTGRKGTGRPGRRVVKDQDREASDTEDKKDLSGSELDGKEEGTVSLTNILASVAHRAHFTLFLFYLL